jgi:ArsR family transcriptional regulator, arsenate/arsenite/antimonite-responsive transcriptional repressor
MEMKNAITALSALGHEGRLSAFRTLVKEGRTGLPAGEIARRLGVPPNTLSANLSILSNAGLVDSRRDGRSIIYTARYDYMSELLGYLVEDCCSASHEICASLADVVARTACHASGAA